MQTIEKLSSLYKAYRSAQKKKQMIALSSVPALLVAVFCTMFMSTIFTAVLGVVLFTTNKIDNFIGLHWMWEILSWEKSISLGVINIGWISPAIFITGTLYFIYQYFKNRPVIKKCKEQIILSKKEMLELYQNNKIEILKQLNHNVKTEEEKKILDKILHNVASKIHDDIPMRNILAINELFDRCLYNSEREKQIENLKKEMQGPIAAASYLEDFKKSW